MMVRGALLAVVGDGNYLCVRPHDRAAAVADSTYGVLPLPPPPLPLALPPRSASDELERGRRVERDRHAAGGRGRRVQVCAAAPRRPARVGKLHEPHADGGPRRRRPHLRLGACVRLAMDVVVVLLGR